MTYTELIVVLGIFAVLSGITMFNYGEFQAKVDIKNLANDMALRMVEAQKASIFGQFPTLAQQAQVGSGWKPSYGIYINKTLDNKSFVYFVDLNADSLYGGPDCQNECVDKTGITKGNYISAIDVFYQNGTSASLNDITISFVRPSSSAVFRSTSSLSGGISYVQITVASPKEPQANIKLYASGRVQIN